MAAKVQHKNIAVRAVTAFVVLGPDEDSWTKALQNSMQFCAALGKDIEDAGYMVSTPSIVPDIAWISL